MRADGEVPVTQLMAGFASGQMAVTQFPPRGLWPQPGPQPQP